VLDALRGRPAADRLSDARTRGRELAGRQV